MPESTWLRELALPSEAMPRKISLPSPGPEAKAAIAAMPISIWVATRMPVRIGGQASGSSTRRSRAVRDIPMPVAASTSVGSTPRSPTMALRTTGSRPYRVSAMTVGATPRPTIGISRPIMASEGMVRIVAVDVVARSPAHSLRYVSDAEGDAQHGGEHHALEDRAGVLIRVRQQLGVPGADVLPEAHSALSSVSLPMPASPAG